MPSPTVSSLSSEPVEWAPLPVKKLALTGIFVVTISSALGALTLIHLNGGHSLGYFNFVGKIGTSGAYCSFAFGGGFGISMVIIAVKEHRDHKKLIQRDQDSNNGPLKEKKTSATNPASSINPVTFTPTPSQKAPSSISVATFSSETETPKEVEKGLGPPSEADILLAKRIHCSLKEGEWVILEHHHDPFRKYDILVANKSGEVFVKRVLKDQQQPHAPPELSEDFSLDEDKFIENSFGVLYCESYPTFDKIFHFLKGTNEVFNKTYEIEDKIIFYLTNENESQVMEVFDKTYENDGLIIFYQRKKIKGVYTVYMTAFQKDDPDLIMLMKAHKNRAVDYALAELCKLKPEQWTLIPPCHDRDYCILVCQGENGDLNFRAIQDFKDGSQETAENFLKKCNFDVNQYTICFKNYFEYCGIQFKKNPLGENLEDGHKSIVEGRSKNCEYFRDDFCYKVYVNAAPIGEEKFEVRWGIMPHVED